ncbi:MAG: hypothetical protein ACI9F9_000943 [Candidatus Paceibacteria bacterium]|jgi:uncharacterized protein
MHPVSTQTSKSSYEQRVEGLLSSLRKLDSLAVAFSGGVDSTVLLHAARKALGDSCVAVIADSPSLPREELSSAQELAASMGAELVIVSTEELADPRYVANAGDRCYFCKSALFERMQAWAERREFTALAFGEITDDALDDRPGAIAAREFGVLAPLRAAGLSKLDVRRYAREAGLVVAEKPASACLASRVPVGTPVTRERLAQVESAEFALHSRGYEVVRVRHHGSRALLEVGETEFERARAELKVLGTLLADFGFEQFELGLYLTPAERSSTLKQSLDSE